MKKLAVVAIALAAMTTAAAADGSWSASSRIDRREANQEARIQHGLRTGEITRHEYRQLEAEQARIRDMERQAKRDGHIDRSEARRIREAQHSASRHIAQESHDSDRRGGFWRRRWW